MAGALPRPVPRHPLISRTALRPTTGPLPCVQDGNSFVLTRSGRSAIVLALQLARLGRGATVLLPDYYCPTMVAAVEHAGAQPVFYPVREDRQPDVDWLARQPVTRPAAVLAAHFFGLPVDLQPLRDLCNRRGAVLIEDCAHAFFGSCAGVPVGQSGDFVVASLPKFFPVLEGGLLAWRDRDLVVPALRRPSVTSEAKAFYRILEAAAAHGRLPVFNGLVAALASVRKRTSQPRFEHPSPLPDTAPDSTRVRLAALADPLLFPARLGNFEQWLVRRSDRQHIANRRQQNYRQLVRRLRGTPGLTLPFPELPPGAVPYCLPVITPAADLIYPRMRAVRLPVYRWDRYWPGHPAKPSRWGHDLLQVSCHQDLDEADLETLGSMLAAPAPASPA